MINKYQKHQEDIKHNLKVVVVVVEVVVVVVVCNYSLSLPYSYGSSQCVVAALRDPRPILWTST